MKRSTIHFPHTDIRTGKVPSGKSLSTRRTRIKHSTLKLPNTPGYGERTPSGKNLKTRHIQISRNTINLLREPEYTYGVPSDNNLKIEYTRMKPAFVKRLLCVLCFAAASLSLPAQLTVSGELRARSEWRNGQGAPLSKDAHAAFFTSQRTRLSLLFNSYRLKLGLSVQDVRVWGQDVSTINRTTTPDKNGFLLHEAWAEIWLTDTSLTDKSLRLKAGRQELAYDDQRLIGDLGWLQQGRRHDAVVMKYDNKAWSLHLAAAFNQNKENASGTIYNNIPPGNYTASTNGGSMYKSMEFIHLNRQLKAGNTSFLFFADQFNKYRIDSDHPENKLFERGVWQRATTGIYFNNSFNKLTVTTSAYYQFGQNARGQKISAYTFNASAGYAWSRLTGGAGIDYTSGSRGGNIHHTFDPLYGTAHKFWGYMDYFYAASPFGGGGLADYHLDARWKGSDRLTATARFHQFSSAARLTNAGSYYRNLGQELDLTASWSITDQAVIESGYSHYFSTNLLNSAGVKNITNPRPGADWAYVMLIIKPTFHFNNH